MKKRAKVKAGRIAVALPVLSQLKVNEYALFPGDKNQGLQHTFRKDVSVIVGVNGLGKTTLLNVIFRLIVGPFDPEKSDKTDTLAASRELVSWKTPDYFSNRVPDKAKQAEASGIFEYGKSKLGITRNLKNLQITKLSLNGKALSPTEKVYEQTILKLSGLATRYDFDFLIRNFLFFFEQRTPIFWNEMGQFDVFRVLFLNATLSKRLSEQMISIQEIDSDFRNRRWALNRRIKEAQNLQSKLQKSQPDAAQLEALRARLEGLREQSVQSQVEIDDFFKRRTRDFGALETLRLELDQEIRENQKLQDQFFTRLFPDVPESFQYIVTQLMSKGGCLVCGNESAELSPHLRKHLKDGRCPLCESPPETHDRVVPLATFTKEQLLKTEKGIQRLRSNIESSSSALADLSMAISSKLDERRQLAQSEAEVANGIQTIEALLNAVEGQTAAKKEMADEEAFLDKLKQDLTNARQQYQATLDTARSELSQFSDQVKLAFEKYARNFLEEKCELSYEDYFIKIGQEGSKFKIPNFRLMMTSATSTSKPTARIDSDDVSESQKEFIDLAFRMALLQVVIDPKTSSMLLIETPEASLDSIFVANAGELLRSYASRPSSHGNVLIATCNLNSEKMIPALLGLKGVRKAARASKIKGCLLNLLDIAAPNASLRKHRARYQSELANLLR